MDYHEEYYQEPYFYQEPSGYPPQRVRFQRDRSRSAYQRSQLRHVPVYPEHKGNHRLHNRREDNIEKYAPNALPCRLNATRKTRNPHTGEVQVERLENPGRKHACKTVDDFSSMEDTSFASNHSSLSVDVSNEMAAVNRDIEALLARYEKVFDNTIADEVENNLRVRQRAQGGQVLGDSQRRIKGKIRGDLPLSNDQMKILEMEKPPLEKLKEIPIQYLKPRLPPSLKERMQSVPDNIMPDRCSKKEAKDEMLHSLLADLVKHGYVDSVGSNTATQIQEAYRNLKQLSTSATQTSSRVEKTFKNSPGMDFIPGERTDGFSRMPMNRPCQHFVTTYPNENSNWKILLNSSKCNLIPAGALDKSKARGETLTLKKACSVETLCNLPMDEERPQCDTRNYVHRAVNTDSTERKHRAVEQCSPRRCYEKTPEGSHCTFHSRKGSKSNKKTKHPHTGDISEAKFYLDRALNAQRSSQDPTDYGFDLQERRSSLQNNQHQCPSEPEKKHSGHKVDKESLKSFDPPIDDGRNSQTTETTVTNYTEDPTNSKEMHCGSENTFTSTSTQTLIGMDTDYSLNDMVKKLSLALSCGDGDKSIAPPGSFVSPSTNTSIETMVTARGMELIKPNCQDQTASNRCSDLSLTDRGNGKATGSVNGTSSDSSKNNPAFNFINYADKGLKIQTAAYFCKEERTLPEEFGTTDNRDKLDTGLCIEIIRRLTDSMLNCEKAGLQNTNTSKTLKESVYLTQLKQLRTDHLKHIQREVKHIEDLDRFLSNFGMDSLKENTQGKK